MECSDDKWLNPDDFLSSSASLDLATTFTLSDKQDEAIITPNESKATDLTAVDKRILNSNTMTIKFSATPIWL